MSRQDEADALPTHPLFGRWIACPCGYAKCRRVYPSAIGTFTDGTGFEPEEVQRIIESMREPR